MLFKFNYMFFLGSFRKFVAIKSNSRPEFSKNGVGWSGRHLTPAGRRGKAETPQAKPRRLSSLPAESKCLQRKPTAKDSRQKQQSMRKEPFLLASRLT